MLRKPLPKLELVGYAMVLGGALSNGLDRALRGYVVDFLDFHAWGWHWPAFNFADMGIVCGAALVVFASWSHKRRRNLHDGFIPYLRAAMDIADSELAGGPRLHARCTVFQRSHGLGALRALLVPAHRHVSVGSDTWCRRLRRMPAA